jgi:carboxypeptidase C (cathepsin A)
MPKLNGLHIAQRLRERIEVLQRGDAVAIREIKSLLNSEQQAWMDQQWTLQLQLREQQPARTSAAQAALGYKTKRDIQIEALQRASEAANSDQLCELKRLQQQGLVRQTRIYLDTINNETKNGKDIKQAQTIANNNLTKAKLPRMDGAKVNKTSARDREVWAMEDALRAQFEAEMTDQEREQLALIKELEQSRKAKSGKTSKTGLKKGKNQ